MTTIRELLTGSLRLLNVVQTNETPTAADMDVALSGLQGLVDSWSAERLKVYTVQPHNFALTPGQQKYLLGPALDDSGNATGADWVIERPMNIQQATLMYNPVIVPSALAASFTYNNIGLEFNFTNTTTNGDTSATYAWDFGDGNTSTDENPAHTYASAGDYVVTLTVTCTYADATTGSTVTATSPPPAYSWATRTDGTVQYLNEYITAMTDAGCTDPISTLNANWDRFVAPQPQNTTYSSATEVVFSPMSTQNVVLQRNLPVQGDAFVWEMLPGSLEALHTHFTGLAINEGWRDPDGAYGVAGFPGPYGYVAYTPDGNIVLNNGIITTTTAPTYTFTDVIGFGFFWGFPTSTLQVFKNGALVASFHFDGNDTQNSRPLAGVVPSP